MPTAPAEAKKIRERASDATALARTSAALKRGIGSRSRHTGLLFAAPAMVFLLAFVAYPVVDAIRLSVLEIDFVSGADRFVAAKNYAEIFQSPKEPAALHGRRRRRVACTYTSAASIRPAASVVASAAP